MKWFLTITILLLVAFVALTSFVNIQAKQFITHSRDIRQRDKDISEAIATIIKSRDELDKFQAEAKQLESAFFTQEELINYIVAEGPKHGVTVTLGSTPIPEAAIANKAIPFSLKVTGPNVAATTKYITALETGKAYATITKYSVATPTGLNGVVEATVDIVGQIR